MGRVKINQIINNDEIIAMIMDIVATKYDCHVNFDVHTKNVSNDCDEDVKPAIVHQVAGILGVTEEEY